MNEVLRLTWGQLKKDVFWLQLPYPNPDGVPIPVKIDFNSAKFLVQNKTHDIRYLNEGKQGSVWVIFPLVPPKVGMTYQQDKDPI